MYNKLGLSNVKLTHLIKLSLAIPTNLKTLADYLTPIATDEIGFSSSAVLLPWRHGWS